MKKCTVWIITLLCRLSLMGCGAETAPAAPDPSASSADGTESLPFQEGQLYAAAYLGYGGMEDLSYYTQTCLNGAEPPVFYLSAGEYYLIIPRYADTTLRLYRSDIETGDRELVWEDPGCRPFIIQCNVSDIFADAVISLTHGEETAEFSPCISLKDGSVQVGERGLNITKQERG